MKFKFLLAALALSTFMCVPAQAQDDMETRHEVAVSYGVKPNSTWFDVLTDIIPAMFGETHENYKCVGPIGLEYYYHTSPLIGVGAVAVFTTNKEDGFYEEIQNSHINRTYFTFMPSVKFNWLRKNHWGLYSKLAAGVTYAYFNEKARISTTRRRPMTSCSTSRLQPSALKPAAATCALLPSSVSVSKVLP